MDPAKYALSKSLALTCDENPLKTNVIKSTKEQGKLGIPIELVYIAGLVLSGKKFTPSTSSPLNSMLQDDFTRLQENYTNARETLFVDNHKSGDGLALKSKERTFYLSPRIIPTREQQQIIDNDISKKRNELEADADAVVQELLKNERQADMTNDKRKTKRNAKNSKNNNKKSPNPEIKKSPPFPLGTARYESSPKVDPTKSTEPSFQTLDDISSRKNPPSSVEKNSGVDGGESGDSGNGDAWISVVTKSLKLNPVLSNLETDGNTSHKSSKDTERFVALLDMQAVATTKINNELLLDDDRKSTNTEPKEDCRAESYLLVAKNSVHPNSNKIPHVSITTNQSLHTKKTEEQDKIQKLENALSLKDIQLENERISHNKELRAEKERFQNSIQDLQLRLYITETRLKTYQDALDQHVESVASNLSNNYTPSLPAKRSTLGIGKMIPSSQR